jgi:hypothetical protein
MLTRVDKLLCIIQRRVRAIQKNFHFKFAPGVWLTRFPRVQREGERAREVQTPGLIFCDAEPPFYCSLHYFHKPTIRINQPFR